MLRVFGSINTADGWKKVPIRFFPDLVKKNHVFILQTPLFRVRNKKETRYCYNEEERKDAIDSLGKNPEITRFKGLGEISPHEFKFFIGENIKLDPVMLDRNTTSEDLMSFYMGKNTQERQKFIINNLKVELDFVDNDWRRRDFFRFWK